MNDDIFGTIERFKRQRARFSCFGMSCGVTALVLLAVAVAIYFITARG